jgi:hypothetical protein
VQRGGFASEEDARAELGRALERLRRTNGVAQTLTLAELVEQYLAQHDVSPVTLKKLRFLLARAVPRFGDYPLDELDPVESAAWRMSVPPGYRFEATQALRQVLAAPSCGGCSTSTRRSRASNPAKQGIANPQRRRTEKRPSSRGRSSRRSRSGSARGSGHYGHLARDGREHASDSSMKSARPRWTFVDARWTPKREERADPGNGKRR